MSHTPEPWQLDEWNGVCGSDGAQIIGGPNNSRRIVACVNACAGIQTETLESITSGASGKWNTLDEMFKRDTADNFEQRDKLIASLRLILDQVDYTRGACALTEMPHVWTLFCHGAYIKPWGFMKPIDTVAGEELLLWVPHAYQTDEASGKQRWWDTAPHGADEHRRMPA